MQALIATGDAQYCGPFFGRDTEAEHVVLDLDVRLACYGGGLGEDVKAVAVEGGSEAQRDLKI